MSIASTRSRSTSYIVIMLQASGDGLTRFFVEGGFANPDLSHRPELAESMASFYRRQTLSVMYERTLMTIAVLAQGNLVKTRGQV